MKHLIIAAAALGLTGALAACGQKEATTASPATTAPVAAGSNMAGMAMSADAKMAKGSGTVTAVDATAGTITLDHGPIPEADWPAMTMGFKAAPNFTQSVKVGDKVVFDVKLQDGAGEITAIQKQ